MSIYQTSQQDYEQQLLEKFKDLIVEHNEQTGSNIPTEYELELSNTQKYAFEKFKKGESLLILGPAGTGKSQITKTFYKWITNTQQKTMYLTSTTGISAYNIGGITINSFMGIGTGESSVETIIRRLKYKTSIKNRIKMTDILVIDEISMMSASVFEKINHICQILKRSNKPFGGIQIILTGDLLQLETIFNTTTPLNNNSSDNRLIIESELFKKMFTKSTVVLQENFRQKTDTKYIDILMRIRKGLQNEQDIKTLQTRLVDTDKNSLIYLVSSNKKAQLINSKQLDKIKEEDYLFECQFSRYGNTETCDLLEKELRSQFSQRGIDTLKLRKGCRVLLIKNLDVSLGLVNGSIGTVKDFINNKVVVEFDNGVTEHIGKIEWELEMDNSKIVATQIPFMLAYSITIHRCQGLSIDKAILDLADCFCNHMVYVALSRVRSLEGVYLHSFNPKKITVNEKLLDFINEIETKN
jgi:ATP-dependent DNA helicase PIF1